MSEDTSSRRRILRRSVGAVSLLGLTGCLSEGPNGSTESSQTTTKNTRGTKTTPDAAETQKLDQGSTPASYSKPRSVSFEAPHGATIKATLYGSGDCGIVLVPQINLDRGSWKPLATKLASTERQVLAIDEDPDNRPASVAGAIRYLREKQNVSTIVLIGASTGGEAVVVANARAKPGTVDGTITLSAGGGAERASDLQGRLLVVVSENDDDRFVRVARQLHKGASEPKELIVYEGSAHGQAILETKHGDALRKKIMTMVSDVCG